MTRRVLIGTGVTVAGAGGLLVAADRVGRLDDVADLVGLDPKPLPDPGDTRVLRRAAIATETVRRAVEATAAALPALDLSPVAAAVGEQLAALGGLPTDARLPDAEPVGADAAVALASLEAVLDTAARARAADAEAAGAPELVRVLASIAAGHAQASRFVRGLA